MDITVAISGGTDSLFALLSLKEAGHRVTALHARFLGVLYRKLNLGRNDVHYRHCAHRLALLFLECL